MGIDLTRFWANLFIFFFESKYIKQLISSGSFKANKVHYDLRAINDDNEFLTSFKNIYSKELELKVGHQENHASFLDFDSKI